MVGSTSLLLVLFRTLHRTHSLATLTLHLQDLVQWNAVAAGLMRAIRNNGSLRTVLVVYRECSYSRDETEAPSLDQRSVIRAYTRRNEQVQHWFASSADVGEPSAALLEDGSTMPFHQSMFPAVWVAARSTKSRFMALLRIKDIEVVGGA
jgi:hypothetical protein